MRRTKEDSEQTKQQVLHAALKIFSAQGYKKAQLNEIAELAGVTRGAIYWHFKNKEDLFIKLIQTISMKSQQVMMRVIQQGASFLEITTNILIEQWSLLEDDEEYKQTMKLVLLNAGDLQLFEELRQQQLLSDQAMIQQITEFMAMGIQQGVLRQDLDSVAAAHSYLAIQKGFAMNWLLMNETFSIKELAKDVAKTFIKGLS